MSDLNRYFMSSENSYTQYQCEKNAILQSVRKMFKGISHCIPVLDFIKGEG